MSRTRPLRREQTFSWGDVARLILGILILDLLLIFPNHPGAVTPEALLLMPWELPVLLLLLVFLPPRAGRILVGLTGLILALTMLVKSADLISNMSIGRPFSFVLDTFLLSAAWQLGVGNFGVIATAVALVLVVLLFCGIGFAAAWAARQVTRSRETTLMHRVAVGSSLAVLIAFAGAEAAHEVGSMKSRTAAFTSHVVLDHVRYAYEGLGDKRRFREAAAVDRFSDIPPGTVLQGLRGRDVLLTFVESLGQANLVNPLYAETTRGALGDLQETVRARGLAVRSAWLTSPVMGGGSWYAHETLMSGLRIDRQTRYDALLASGRETLLDMFAKAGWDTVAVVPQITQAWPEGKLLGFQRIYDAQHLGYKGQPFNWVTMPDQFTLEQLYRRELSRPNRPPVFAVTALASSHAPWTPIPHLIDWDDIGDGSIFDVQAESGDSPEVVWSNPDRIRDQFRKAIRYSLRTIDAFVASRLTKNQVLIFLGDHQPAPLVAGADASHNVPIVIIAEPEVLSALDDWGWAHGAIPDDQAPVWPMQAFRNRFLEAFTPTADAQMGPRTSR